MKSLRAFIYVIFIVLSVFLIYINFNSQLSQFNGFRLFFAVACLTASGFAVFKEIKSGKVPVYFFVIGFLLLGGAVYSGRISDFFYSFGEEKRIAAAEKERAALDSLAKKIEEQNKPKPDPFYHFYKQDEICDLNIRELQYLGKNLLKDNLPYAKKSKTRDTPENLGTDRFRVIGTMQTVHKYIKHDNEAILKMMKPYSEPFKQISTGFMLQFKDKKTVDNLKLNTYYEVTGRIKVYPTFKKYQTIEEFKKAEQTYGTYLEVESFREVNPPEDAVIRKFSKVPPFNPIIPVSDSLMEVLKNAE